MKGIGGSKGERGDAVEEALKEEAKADRKADKYVGPRLASFLNRIVITTRYRLVFGNANFYNSNCLDHWTCYIRTNSIAYSLKYTCVHTCIFLPCIEQSIHLIGTNCR